MMSTWFHAVQCGAAGLAAAGTGTTVTPLTASCLPGPALTIWQHSHHTVAPLSLYTTRQLTCTYSGL